MGILKHHSGGGSIALSLKLGTHRTYNPLKTTSVDDSEHQSPESVSLVEGAEPDVAKSRRRDVGEPALSVPGEATPESEGVEVN
jgi:hypothetical protein